MNGRVHHIHMRTNDVIRKTYFDNRQIVFFLLFFFVLSICVEFKREFNIVHYILAKKQNE